MELKKDFKYSLVVPTSMGLRMTPLDSQPVHVAESFMLKVSSAETNVASIASYLGLPVKVLTTFVKGSPIADKIKRNLRERNMDFEGIDVDPGGPWGYRHQINIADSGYGMRGPRVCNDRAGEVGRTLNVEDFDLQRLFGEEGVQILHISGLIGALSPETGQFCLKLAQEAKKYGTLISFDLNHRASFWEGREAELRDIFTQITEISDIMIGNEEDFQLALGIEGPETGGSDIETKIERFKGMIDRIREVFPSPKVIATTLREVEHANSHQWGAIVWEHDNWHIVKPKPIFILDRIGGGDGFVGGLLYAILKGWDSKKWIQFGWASGALATTFFTDYAQPADEDQIWDIWKGNARVKR